MKHYLFTTLFLGIIGAVNAQPTWSGEAAQVFYDKCSQCHNDVGVGPFSVTNYEAAYDYRALIQAYVDANIMPPWSADSSFQHYFGERILTSYERSTIIDWANGGGLEGDPALMPPPPIYSGDKILPGTPDLTIQMPNYMSKATEAYDDYVCISLPTGLTEGRRVKAIEIIPGNSAIVHHCLIYYDAAATYATDTTGGDCGGPGGIPLMAGYIPGSSPTIFPSNDDFSAGMLMEEGSNVVLAMHYPHGSYGQFDQTKVNFYFYDEPVTGFREISAGAFIQNWVFDLPADEVTTVSGIFSDTPLDFSVLSTFPHMHLLGKSIEAFGIDPSGDTIPFIRIPHWDFDWQDFYWFKYMQKLPAGSDLIGNGTYDNTIANPHNPSDPPVDVGPGLNTTDEMFLVYFHIMLYQPGDEYVNVDSLNTIYLNTPEFEINFEYGISVYPNPFDETISIEYNLVDNSVVSLYIYDLSGKVVNKLLIAEQQIGPQQVVWDGTGTDGSPVAGGIYNYSMLINGEPYSGRIIKQ